MLTHTHIRGILVGTITVKKNIDVTAEQENNLDVTIAAAGTNVDHGWACDVSQLKSLFLIADGALTIKTNSSGSPANTFTLVENEPFMWRTGDGTLRDTGGTAVTVDITKLLITNADPDNAVALKLFALIDPTI